MSSFRLYRRIKKPNKLKRRKNELFSSNQKVIEQLNVVSNFCIFLILSLARLLNPLYSSNAVNELQADPKNKRNAPMKKMKFIAIKP